MKATEAKLLDFLRKSEQFVIPIYQRTYSWTKPECYQLFNDILRTGHGTEISAHFIGSIVYIEKGLSQVTNQTPLLVIDGQQRLTTITLLIEALAQNVDKEPIDGFSTEKLRGYYLVNSLEKDDRRFKLILTQTDKDTLLALVDQKPLPQEISIRIQENFKFLEQKIKQLGDQDMRALCIGLSKLTVVDIALNRDHDNPQLIFESMNSTGRELSQADLIRNYILMGLEHNEQKQLYKDYWRPMETLFGQKAYSKTFDSFMRHYLIVKTGEIPNIRKVYEQFKIYARDQKIHEVVENIYKYAKHYCAMAFNQEKNIRLASSFADLRELKMDVAYPFLLELYDDYSSNILSDDELYQIVRMIESYIFRRSVCQIPTNSLNKTFATFTKDLNKDRLSYFENIKTKFLSLKSYRRFPNNDEFRDKFRTRDLYNFRNRSYWIRRFENHNRRERVVINEHTIEHIMPQNLTIDWEIELGQNWSQIHEKWLHTLGNLTLTGYNSEYSNRSFAKKRDMEGGFKESPLQVNKGIGELEKWNEYSIIERGKRLSYKAPSVWSYPTLSDETLHKYSPSTQNGVDSYTILDHPYLLGEGLVPTLYNLFRSEVLNLDQCVTEEFLELYVAYKAETNFVYIIPLVNHLQLTLNLRFHELQDPKKLAKDVTGLNQWANGNAEIDLKREEELPYVLGLVRQALEKQMGGA